MKERILQKTGRIREYLSIVISLKPDCQEKFSTDPVYRGAMLHYLYLISDSCISLAEIVIKYKGLRPPQSYHEAFDILGDANILDNDFAYSFAKIAGFRNFLAYDYEIVDAELICKEVLRQLDDVKEFIDQIEQQGAGYV
ncbi:type VII toxin-antitoxin system HepT family RNase toxin [Desulfobacula sp.]